MQVFFDDADELIWQPFFIKDFERGASGQNDKQDIKAIPKAAPGLKAMMKPRNLDQRNMMTPSPN